MNERLSVRYDSELLPGHLRKVTISWEENPPIETNVVNCCALGMRVLIPPLRFPTEIPKKSETIKVQMPIDQMWFTGMCIYATNEFDGSVSMGIYFYNPSEQNYLNNLLSKLLNEPPQSWSFVCHEWEELVTRLCNSEDSKLKEIGYREMEIITAQRGGNASGQSADAE